MGGVVIRRRQVLGAVALVAGIASIWLVSEPRWLKQALWGVFLALMLLVTAMDFLDRNWTQVVWAVALVAYIASTWLVTEPQWLKQALWWLWLALMLLANVMGFLDERRRREDADAAAGKVRWL